MSQLILMLHILIAICLIVLVLIQHGKGADAGAAFGSGSSNTMFGSAGVTPFLTKITALLALLFFLTSLTLSFIAGQQVRQAKALQPTPIQQSLPSTQGSQQTPVQNKQ